MCRQAIQATGHPAVGQQATPATGDRPTGEGEYYAPTGIRKAVALTNEYLGLTKALELYHAGQQESARKLVDQVKAQLEAAKSALQTTDLDAEIRMITKLSTNMGGTASPSMWAIA